MAVYMPIHMSMYRHGPSQGYTAVLVFMSDGGTADAAKAARILEQIAASRSIVPEVLEAIAKDRQMSRRYSVVATLARNPKTPVGIAIRLCSRLSVRDLRSVSRDHNAQDAVRSTCRRLYTIKHQ